MIHYPADSLPGDSRPGGPGGCGVILAMAIPRTIDAWRMSGPPRCVLHAACPPPRGTTTMCPRALVYPQAGGPKRDQPRRASTSSAPLSS